jgi:hypothetical protein
MIYDERTKIQGIEPDRPPRSRQGLLKRLYVSPERNLAVRCSAEIFPHNRWYALREHLPEILCGLRVRDSIRPFPFASTMNGLQKYFHSQISSVLSNSSVTRVIR